MVYRGKLSICEIPDERVIKKLQIDGRSCTLLDSSPHYLANNEQQKEKLGQEGKKSDKEKEKKITTKSHNKNSTTSLFMPLVRLGWNRIIWLRYPTTHQNSMVEMPSHISIDQTFRALKINFNFKPS